MLVHLSLCDRNTDISEDDIELVLINTTSHITRLSLIGDTRIFVRCECKCIANLHES